MAALIYLVRHGEVDMPSPRPFLGWADPPLNASGVRQALALHQQLQDIRFTRIFASPLRRAVQTATLVAGVPAESVQLVEPLKEINLGAWEGLTVDEVRRRFPGEYERRGRELEFFRPEGGESFSDLAGRCYPGLLSLAKAFAGPLLVVAHAGVNRVLLSRLQQRPLRQLFDFQQEYCDINILRYEHEVFNVEAINLHPGEFTIPAGISNREGRKEI